MTLSGASWEIICIDAYRSSGQIPTLSSNSSTSYHQFQASKPQTSRSSNPRSTNRSPYSHPPNTTPHTRIPHDAFSKSPYQSCWEPGRSAWTSGQKGGCSAPFFGNLWGRGTWDAASGACPRWCSGGRGWPWCFCNPRSCIRESGSILRARRRSLCSRGEVFLGDCPNPLCCTLRRILIVLSKQILQFNTRFMYVGRDSTFVLLW